MKDIKTFSNFGFVVAAISFGLFLILEFGHFFSNATMYCSFLKYIFLMVAISFLLVRIFMFTIRMEDEAFVLKLLIRKAPLRIPYESFIGAKLENKHLSIEFYSQSKRTKQTQKVCIKIITQPLGIAEEELARIIEKLEFHNIKIDHSERSETKFNTAKDFRYIFCLVGGGLIGLAIVGEILFYTLNWTLKDILVMIADVI